MSSEQVRQGVTQAAANETAYKIIGVDLLVLCGAAWYFSGNWVYAVVTLAAVMILLQIKAISQIFTWIMSAGWAFAAYKLSLVFDAGTLGAIVVAAIVGILALGAHMGAMQLLHDINGSQSAPSS